jgi:hypothetical protein
LRQVDMNLFDRLMNSILAASLATLFGCLEIGSLVALIVVIRSICGGIR